MADPASVAALAQITDVAARGLRYTASVVPVGGSERQAGRADRRAAYLTFQASAASAVSSLMFSSALDEAMPNLLTRFTYMSAVLDQLWKIQEQQSLFLAALHNIRLVGNPAPRVAAEELAALVGELPERMPRTRRPETARNAEELRRDECLRAIGEANRKFTMAARRDLGLGPSLLQRVLPARWRREEWPGGWPGPDPVALIREAAQLRDARGETPSGG